MDVLKRKFGNRSDWKRILERRYAQKYLESGDFTGNVTLLHTLKVTEPLFVSYGEKKLCIVDDGYMWLQQFPLKEKHSVTTMYDKCGNVLQWYIDICLENGMENGIPYMDDLYLDIVVLPSGEVIEKDADELEQAFFTGVIDKTLYDMAWDEAERLSSQLNDKGIGLMKLSNAHKELLVHDLT
ncbi:DUF402 domain-containing protein [Sutcliffiella halmapala]